MDLPSETPKVTATGSPTSFNATSLPLENSTTILPRPTPISLDVLTTPFIPPSGCTPVPSVVWTAATVHNTTGGRNDTITYPNYLFADLDDRVFSDCQPSGWDSVATRSRFSYSPAVCPSGWGYWQLSDGIPRETSDTATVTSSARCCPSGFRFSSVFYSDQGFTGMYCVSTPTEPPQLKQRATVTDLATTKIYPAWQIFWEQRDAASLSPEPPDLSVGFAVPTWEPGTKIDDKYKRQFNDGSAFGRDISQGIIAIVVGTIGAIALIAAISLFFILRNRKRKRRLQQAIELQERHDSSRRDRVHDEPLPIYPSQGTRDNTVHIAGHQPGGQAPLPPYKERASEDSSSPTATGGDEDRGGSASSGHERQHSRESASAGQRGSTSGGTTRQQSTNDDITAQPG